VTELNKKDLLTEGKMTKLHVTVIILGSSLFFLDFSLGIGWLLGWLFAGLLRINRERILERIIDFENFSMKTYIIYLLGVMVWIAIPLLASLFVPQYISPWAIFGAYIADRILMFIINAFSKGGG